MGAKFYIYWNLHRNLWSVKYRGKVVAHETCIAAFGDVRFQVSQPGRLRVLQEKRKNVHAFVVCDAWAPGVETVSEPGYHDESETISYNPYTAGYFRGEDDRAVSGAVAAFLTPDRIVKAWNVTSDGWPRLGMTVADRAKLLVSNHCGAILPAIDEATMRANLAEPTTAGGTATYWRNVVAALRELVPLERPAGWRCPAANDDPNRGGAVCDSPHVTRIHQGERTITCLWGHTTSLD